jgi:hypothetical protein
MKVKEPQVVIKSELGLFYVTSKAIKVPTVCNKSLLYKECGQMQKVRTLQGVLQWGSVLHRTS